MFVQPAGTGSAFLSSRLVKMSPTGGTHGRRTFDLGAALGAYAMQHDLGVVLGAETGFNLTRPDEGRETVLAPDVAFVRAENAMERRRLVGLLVGACARTAETR